MTTVLLELDPLATAMRGKAAGYTQAKASIHQIVQHGLNTGWSGYSYHFPYMPVEMSFDKLGAEYEEIERPGNYSLVSRRAPALLRASFEFRVAHRPSNGLQSIEHDLEVLHKIAKQDEPIVVVGFGTYFSGTRASPGEDEVSVLFRVVEFNAKVVRRGLNNEPWQADCKMDLVEYRNPLVLVAPLASIDYSVTPVSRTTTSGVSGNKPSGSGPAPTTTPPVGLYSDASDAVYIRKSDQT